MPHRSYTRPALAGFAAAALACVVVLAACGGSGDGGSASDLGSDQDLQHLTCADWHAADDATRGEILGRLREIIGGQVTGAGANGNGSVLSDEQANAVFDRQCAATYAQAFGLYKLLGFASGFAGG